MKLYLVRHAESMGNATGEYSTLVSDSLSPKGEEQARVLAAGLTGMEFDRIVVSPRLRTLQTIAPYLSATGRQAEIWPEVAEACWHEEREAAAQHWQEEEGSLPCELEPLFTWYGGRAVVPRCNETFGEGLRRVNETVARLGEIGNGETSLLMVAHGHLIRELLNILLETSEMNPFHHENTGLTLLTCNDAWKLEWFNRQAKDI